MNLAPEGGQVPIVQGGGIAIGESSSSQPSSSTNHTSRWYFTRQQLNNTISIRHELQPEKELSYRQQAANFIQDMGQRLQVTQLCINTAIVYMQRFYMFHSFCRFHRNSIASASLFLAAKVEEQPRKLEHVIKVAHICLHRDQPQLDTRSEAYIEQAQELVTNENILLQTLGFDVAIDHPHTHVVRCCQLVKASKELAQTSYFMATNSLHLTTMCLRYPPTIVACVCIHLACKWSNYKIPLSAQNRPWFSYVDTTATLPLLDKLTDEFLLIFDKCPSRLKKKIMASSQATREEEERRARGAILASSYQPDFSSKADDSAKVVGKISSKKKDGDYDAEYSGADQRQSSNIGRTDAVKGPADVGIASSVRLSAADSNSSPTKDRPLPEFAVDSKDAKISSSQKKSIFDLDTEDDISSLGGDVQQPAPSVVLSVDDRQGKIRPADLLNDVDEDDIDRLIGQEAANVPIDDFDQSTSDISLSLGMPAIGMLQVPEVKSNPCCPPTTSVSDSLCKEQQSLSPAVSANLPASTVKTAALAAKLDTLFATDSEEDVCGSSADLKRSRLSSNSVDPQSESAKRLKLSSDSGNVRTAFNSTPTSSLNVPLGAVEKEPLATNVVNRDIDIKPGTSGQVSVVEVTEKAPDKDRLLDKQSKKKRRKGKKLKHGKKSKHRHKSSDDEYSSKSNSSDEKHRNSHKKKKKKHKHRKGEASDSEKNKPFGSENQQPVANASAKEVSSACSKKQATDESQGVSLESNAGIKIKFKTVKDETSEQNSPVQSTHTPFTVAPLKISLPNGRDGTKDEAAEQKVRNASRKMSRAMGSSHDLESRCLNQHLSDSADDRRRYHQPGKK